MTPELEATVREKFMPWTSYIISATELTNAVLNSNLMGRNIRIKGLNAPLEGGLPPFQRLEPGEASRIIKEWREEKPSG